MPKKVTEKKSVAVKRVYSLTDSQSAQMTAWADKWIEIGLRTGPADRETFVTAAKECYCHAKIDWPGNVVWVSSPLVIALAAPIASLLIQLSKKKQVGDAVRGAVGDAVGGAVRGAVGDAVGGAVGGAVRDAEIRKAVSEVIRRSWANYLGGQFWVGGWYWGGAFTSFFREICNLALTDDLWSRGISYEQTMQSACWWYPHRDFVMVCERPTVINRELVNPNNPRGWGSHRLHCSNGPAVAWPDGWGVYSIHGVRVPGWLVEHPEKITIQNIKSESNAEVRRIMIERFGEARYVEESGLEPIAHDIRFGTIYLEHHPSGRPTSLLKVTNRTVEPDGSFKRYYLPFNPDHYNGDAGRVPQAAVASTWRTTPGGKKLLFEDWREYSPMLES